MKSGHSDITFILDRSGSMSKLYDDVIGGFNKFLQSQKEAPGTAQFTVVMFDHNYDVPFKAVPIAEVPELNKSPHFEFTPRGTTALNDAMGRTIQSIGERLHKTAEEDRPEKVIVVIFTDGLENASQEYDTERVKRMVQRQTDVYSWEFIYLGANQNAVEVGTRLGVPAANSLSYGANTLGSNEAFNSVSSNVSSYRSGLTSHSEFTFNDRIKQAEAGVDLDQNSLTDVTSS
jgi:uncharacterized protein YegL